MLDVTTGQIIDIMAQVTEGIDIGYHPGEVCRYWNFDSDLPTCLVGTILHRLGATRDDFVGRNQLPIERLAKKLDSLNIEPLAVAVLRLAQRRQDSRVPWAAISGSMRWWWSLIEPCELCQAKIIWTVDAFRGTNVPIDAMPQFDGAGARTLSNGWDGKPRSRLSTPKHAFGRTLYTPHLSTCAKPKLLTQKIH